VFQELVNHNPDLEELLQKGFALGYEDGYLIVLDIPYLDANGELKIGAFVAKTVPIDAHRIRQDDHQVFFCGSHPHNLDGTPIANLAGGPTTLPLQRSDITVERSFSHKPDGGYASTLAKFQQYVAVICGPAMAKFGATPYTFRFDGNVPESVFKFQDSLSSRAEIGDLSRMLANDVVAVIGLGGTGSYMVDFLSRTSVKEIRGFDPDKFHVHNAFRAPGRLVEEEFDKSKAEVHGNRYDNFRRGLTFEPLFVDYDSEQFDGVTFAFVCVDKGASRKGIFDLLMAKGIPFIDVGMGLNRKAGPLNGMLRVTYYSTEEAEARVEQGWAELADADDAAYRANIQTAELNALNAALAIVKFKQLRSYYLDSRNNYHTIYEVDTGSTRNVA
jgi:hypothetical protein